MKMTGSEDCWHCGYLTEVFQISLQNMLSNTITGTPISRLFWQQQVCSNKTFTKHNTSTVSEEMRTFQKELMFHSLPDGLRRISVNVRTLEQTLRDIIFPMNVTST